ncbi:hypothetical protein AB6A40_008567 [Gnathostoma spinigerum]|uniref:Translation initiation factor eIF2B subunit alpha n=1 Tax=Gnathostoma spinigerum TaxID=75299 RepID=A0ABD6EPR8_9BILA
MSVLMSNLCSELYLSSIRFVERWIFRMEDHEAAEYFEELLRKADGEPTSTGLAAIETLLRCIRQSSANTTNELHDELQKVVKAILNTDHSSASVQSASQLFLRFISLATAEQNVQEFSKLMDYYKDRGQRFVERVAKSRSFVSRFARPFIQSNMRILTHSCSRCVLRALVDAKKDGVSVEVFVTEAQPGLSGRRMHRSLEEAGISSTVILDSAVGYVMESIDAVFVGAEGVMETGGIINKIGTLNLAICAKAFNKPLYVMAECIKFIREYPLNQSDIPLEFKYSSSTLHANPCDLSKQHPRADYTPPQYINLLFTDLGILTPAAVADELIKLYT